MHNSTRVKIQKGVQCATEGRTAAGEDRSNLWDKKPQNTQNQAQLWGQRLGQDRGQIVRGRCKQSWEANHKRRNPGQEVTDETKGEDNINRPN